MTTAVIRAHAQALGGHAISPNSLLCPGPGHSAADRSLQVTRSATAPDGFVCRSFAHDGFKECRDHVKERLGLKSSLRNGSASIEGRSATTSQRREVSTNADARRIASARRIVDGVVPPRGTLVEQYLREERNIELDGPVTDLGFHPACPWGENGQTIFVPAMVGVMRSIATEQVVAVHRTRLSPEGKKVDRMMLGPARGAAVMLCPYSAIGAGITVCEGVETALTGWAMGWSNVWALGSAGGIASFPVLGGVQSLVVLCEDDDTNRRAVDVVGQRYADAGREVILVHPNVGSDINDAVRGVSA